MGNLDLDKRYDVGHRGLDVSKTLQGFFVNFVKTGDPNGAGLPTWPTYKPETGFQRTRIDVKSGAGPEPHRDGTWRWTRILGK